MTRLGVDLSHFQDPKAPAGISWDVIGEKSTFAIVRGSYGCWPDPNAVPHTSAARIEAMQVGLYHFLCVGQPIQQQMDVFCAQAVACRIQGGQSDIMPALDIEDDGKNVVSPAWVPLIKQAADVLIAEFGGLIFYLTQRDFARLGKPAWILEHPQWPAYYHPGVDPVNVTSWPTPGGVKPAIRQYRVGPYKPGAAFVLGEQNSPLAIDHDIADAPLPVCTLTPTMPGALPPVGEAPPSHPELWSMRLAAGLQAGLDISHDSDSAEGMGV